MNDARIRLTGELTIYRVAEVRELLVEALRESEEVRLDLEEIREIDAAGVQLLLVALREAGLRQKRLRVVASSPAVDEVLAFLRLTSTFAQRPEDEAVSRAGSAREGA